ncbi:fructose-bisphosphate aldolase [Candidatus Pelagibacter ubique]|uniref:fructose-bisphosphate aldolase n=1 Tax=Pelagibacter ubique TaxID=198252 RepID=A0ABX1SYX8_PELUQ|nr:class I fructose-bisphosphate aldolase [Candidatus Pelagibacter ubique]NMN67042.1 fructose-bisphosphate aldolase [Candidatus Pelagibacter ubique]
MSELNKIALKILSNGKGILAADESTGTMTKRLESVNVLSSAENRLLFRETLFSSESMKNCIGGVILYDETIKQLTNSNKSIPDLISSAGAVPGIKVDTGAKVLAGSPEEKITEGLDGLRERLKEYYQLGAQFTKWRGVYSISNKYPSKLSIYSNAHALARYSALVQECKMVPIVEPEVLMDGNHSAEDCFNITSEVIKKCFEELILHKVDLSGIILKPNMILAGANSEKKTSNEEIAKLTLKCLRENVPSDVPGIAFLSGGQSEVEATENLNLINKNNDTNFIMTYSYGRALQQSALKFWSKDIENTEGTQKVFNHRANMCTLAAQGKWSAELETK